MTNLRSEIYAMFFFKSRLDKIEQNVDNQSRGIETKTIKKFNAFEQL